MKIYNKKYVFKSGKSIDFDIDDRTFDEILKEINKSSNCKFVAEVFKNKIASINLDNVDYILVEEKENGISKSRK